MKKLFLLVFLPHFVLAQDVYIQCTIYPAQIKNAKESDKIKSTYIIKENGIEISLKDSNHTNKLTTTDDKYSWSTTLPPKEGQQLTIVENIDRNDGAYQSFIYGPKGFMPFSLGECSRLDKKL